MGALGGPKDCTALIIVQDAIRERIRLIRRVQREHDAALAGPENAPVAFHQHKEYIRGREAAAAAILKDKG